MPKKFTLACNNNGQITNIDFLVGNPNESSHPIGFQMKFFLNRGIVVPDEVINALNNLHQIAKDNHINFDELLEYVSDQLQTPDLVKEALSKANQFSQNN